VVFHLGEKDDVASFQVRAAPAGGDEIDRFGGSARENDLGRIRESASITTCGF
jgi:hypothetical protein